MLSFSRAKITRFEEKAVERIDKSADPYLKRQIGGQQPRRAQTVERAVTTKYLETNSITKVVLESQQKAVDGIRTSLTDVRSQVRDFYSRGI